MTEALPEPLVPAHVDLNGYEFMPLFGERLRTSSFNARATPEQKWAALQLWWASWWQTPAASLPNSEVELANLAGCKTMRAWRRVREEAMSKWVLCADERWYHPFLAPLAVAAFKTRKSQSLKGAIGAQKRWGNKGQTDGTGIAPAIRREAAGNASANAPAKDSDSTGNSNRSEVNTPLPPRGTPTSTPKAAVHSVTKAAQQIEEQRAWPSTPMPDNLKPKRRQAENFE